MAGKPKDDVGFAEAFEANGPAKLARLLGISTSAVHQRRLGAEARLGRQIKGPDHHRATRVGIQHAGQVNLEIENGTVLIGSDAHFWPDIITTAHKAFVTLCKELQPIAIIANGDMVDGAMISRYPPVNWEKRPSVIEEIEMTQDRLGELTLAAPKARRLWPLGNHDARFESRLATVAPEYARVKGFTLKEHFPDWEPCWSVVINGHTMIKHRWKGGVHAAYNNVLRSGWSFFTGHLHTGLVRPYTDLNGTRYGVDTATLAEPWGPQFEYQEGSPRDQRSGFAVATFHQGRLLLPQMCFVYGPGQVEFERKVIDV